MYRFFFWNEKMEGKYDWHKHRRTHIHTHALILINSGRSMDITVHSIWINRNGNQIQFDSPHQINITMVKGCVRNFDKIERKKERECKKTLQFKMDRMHFNKITIMTKKKPLNNKTTPHHKSHYQHKIKIRIKKNTENILVNPKKCIQFEIYKINWILMDPLWLFRCLLHLFVYKVSPSIRNHFIE